MDKEFLEQKPQNTGTKSINRQMESLKTKKFSPAKETHQSAKITHRIEENIDHGHVKQGADIQNI